MMESREGAGIMRWAFLAFVVSAGAVGASRWFEVPLPRHPTSDATCSSCHEGSIPQGHSREFQLADHGPLALANRAECASCHDNTVCQDCHLAHPPTWHSEAFRHPSRGPRERGEHLRLASARRDSCMECHDADFQRQCADCHRPVEWPAHRERARRRALGTDPMEGGDP